MLHIQARRNSLAPSSRRERPPLRSSPLAGPSFSADSGGNVVQHGSVLEEEITRRRSLLPPVTDDGSVSPPTPTLSPSIISTNATSSRRGSMDETGASLKRARPSFISLSPSSPRNSVVFALPPLDPQFPHPSSLVRSRHTLTQISSATDPNNKPTADWMTVTPAPTFSRLGMHGPGVVLPVKASSRAGEIIRRKSVSGPRSTEGSTSGARTMGSRSLKSFRSMSRLLRTKGEDHSSEKAPSMPAKAFLARSRSASIPSTASRQNFGVGAPAKLAPLAPIIPRTQKSIASIHPVVPVSPEAILGFPSDLHAPNATATNEKNEKRARIKRIWTTVQSGIRWSRIRT